MRSRRRAGGTGAAPVEAASSYWRSHAVTLLDPDGFPVGLSPRRGDSRRRGMLSSVVAESELVSTEHGHVPKGQGWFVVKRARTQWSEGKGRGVLCEFEGAGFEGATDFVQVGINLTLLAPGEPMSMTTGKPIRRTSSSLR